MSVLENVKASWFKWCAAAAPAFTLYNFDAVNGDLPTDSIIGIKGLTLESDEALYIGTMWIGVATTETDENLFALDRCAGAIFDKLRPDTVVDVYDATSGSAVGFMKVLNGTSVSPRYTTGTKPIKFVSVKFSLSIQV